MPEHRRKQGALDSADLAGVERVASPPDYGVEVPPSEANSALRDPGTAPAHQERASLRQLTAPFETLKVPLTER